MAGEKIQSNFNGGIKINQEFLSVLNKSGESNDVLISFVKYNMNLNEKADKNISLSSPIISVEIRDIKNKTFEF